MFVDSHCHLDFPELAGAAAARARRDGGSIASRMRCASASTCPTGRGVLALAEAHRQPLRERRRASRLRGHAGAVGRRAGRAAPRGRRSSRSAKPGSTTTALTGDLEWQRERFRTHIRAARALRQAAGDPHALGGRRHARDHARGARRRGGRRHALLHRNLGRRAGRARPRLPHLVFRHRHVQECARSKDVARRVPLDRMLIETDSPYLAPVPYRGKRNQPAYVPLRRRGDRAPARRAARGRSRDATSANFFRLFGVADHATHSRRRSPQRAAGRGCSRLLAARRLRRRAAAQQLYERFIDAVTNDRADEVAALLARGIDPNTVDPNGDPALSIAARAGFEPTLDALLAAGAKVNAGTATATRAIMVAALARPPGDRQEALRARRRKSTAPGWTPLIYAATDGHDDVARYLLDVGATSMRRRRTARRR